MFVSRRFPGIRRLDLDCRESSGLIRVRRSLTLPYGFWLRVCRAGVNNDHHVNIGHTRFQAVKDHRWLASAYLTVGLLVGFPVALFATPVNKAALANHYDRFLATNLNSCTTCHLPVKLDHPPENLDEFPHNPFGVRLRQLGRELDAAGKKKDISTRLAMIASEDSDGDGVPNETELLLGHAPGDVADKPAAYELADLKKRRVK